MPELTIRKNLLVKRGKKLFPKVYYSLNHCKINKFNCLGDNDVIATNYFDGSIMKEVSTKK